MVVTGKSFEKGPEFCFKDLLDLELHNFADDVSETVDQSAKEAKIDKKLTQIRTTWQKMGLEFDFAREDCPLLKDLGELVEVLEGHALEMMGMTSQGRFIEFCQSVVDEWAFRAGLRGGGGVGMGVSGMVFVGLVLGCIEAKFCK